MSYSLDVLGWEDVDGDSHEGEPIDVSETYGQFVHLHNDDTDEDHWFWVYAPEALSDWDDWVEWIEIVAEQYGYE